MKKAILSLFLTSLLACCQDDGSNARWTLWYEQPARNFTESLVLGNGQMGAILYGNTGHEMISLNDLTLWSGEPTGPNLDTLAYEEGLIPVRKALKEENYPLADQLQVRLQGLYSQLYSPLGELDLDFMGDTTYTDYRRELDVSRGVAKISYKTSEGTFHRQLFVSNPDMVTVLKMDASGKKALNFDLSFQSKLHYQSQALEGGLLQADGYAQYHVESNTIYHWDENRGIHFETLVKVLNKDGSVTAQDGTLQIRDCSEVTLLITDATSFNGFDKDPMKEGRPYKELARKQLDNALEKDYKTLLKAHKEDFASFFDRVDLQLGNEAIPDLPTDERLRAYTQGGSDLNLEMLYFQFGRYLMISASRTRGVPMNLQGLWNESIQPKWNCGFTLNINCEENYWPAEILNLSEMHQPLFDYIHNLSVNGASSARNYYGAGGWSAGHNEDIWASANPLGEHEGLPMWANWPFGSAWLSTHLWEHYLFTKDKTFLRDQAYPLLKGAATFCLDFLVEDKDGYLITAPSTSPENIYVTPEGYHGMTLYGGTADLALIRECLTSTLKAAQVLNEEPEFQQRIKDALSRLLPYHIGKKGNLQEWYYDWEDEEPDHRHQSHLFGLYPGHQITPEETPDLAQACKKTLEIKGDRATGWSTGWRINLWARLLDGEHAYRILRTLLTYVEDINEIYRNSGGTYPNLLDAHPPFQIDGNFGGISGMAEMMLQSTETSIDLLPAIPQNWKDGSFKGFCARGAFVISLDWKDGAVTKGEILSKAGTDCHLRSHTPFKVFGIQQSAQKVGDWYELSFPTQEGQSYRIQAQI